MSVLESLLILDHPISLYFVEASGIVDAFRALLQSYLNGGMKLRLDPSEDAELIGRLDILVDSLFPTPVSTINVSPEKRRLFMYDKLFGLKIQGRQGDIPELEEKNENFYPLVRDAMVNIFKGIHDTDIDTVKIADPGRIAQLLNNLRDEYRYYNINSVSENVNKWTVLFQELIRLLSEPGLVNALNIGSNTGLNERLKALGSAVGVDVSEVFESHLILAQKMAAFLIEVEGTENWTPENVTVLYTDPGHQDLVRDLATQWNRIQPDVDFPAMALANRPT
jgi:hypothetical protein